MLLACLLLWRVVFGGQVFVPAGLLHYFAPWQQQDRPAWNPLMYDAVGQFYPWRHFAGETLRAGRIPLWNPYQFCGTPFVANSQSAVFYPGNLLFYLLSTASAAGWTVLLHLLLAAAFTYAFLRALGLSACAGALGGVAFAFSTWQVSWLELPTFLDTSCWLPLVLLLTFRLFRPAPGALLRKEGEQAASGIFVRREGQSLARRWHSAVGLGFALGIALLAGHLQIAFYVILAAVLLAIWLLLAARRRARADQGEDGAAEAQSAIRSPQSAIARFLLALVFAAMLAAPQVVPALELSRRSHRVGPASAQGYAAYTAYAVSPGALVTLVLPNFYGNPSYGETPYFGASRGGMYFNYAEGALYVGLPTLLLAAYALVRRRQPGRLIGYFGLLAALSLLMALGTPLDALLYFGVPGFGQSGSPGRALVLWTFALAALAALGYEKLTQDEAAPIKSAGAAVGIVVVLAAVFFVAAAASVSQRGIAFSEIGLAPQLARQGAILLLSGGAVVALAARRHRKPGAGWLAAAPLALLCLDLLATGIGYNLTAQPAEVYPPTALTAFLRRRAGHDRVMPVNTGWSFAGPRGALPPNGAMAFGLHDVQGYDSLFPGQYKAFMNALAGPGQDSSPPEVGNMVFAKDPASPLAQAAGVRFVLSDRPLPLAGALPPMDGAHLYELTGAPGRASARTQDGGPVAVEWLEDTPTRVTLRLDAPAPCALTLADELYPGWSAEVDDRPAAIQRTGTIFRQVAVPPGRHTVTFAYRPAGFRFGLYLLLAALTLGAATLTAGIRVRRPLPGG